MEVSKCSEDSTLLKPWRSRGYTWLITYNTSHTRLRKICTFCIISINTVEANKAGNPTYQKAIRHTCPNKCINECASVLKVNVLIHQSMSYEKPIGPVNTI